MPFSYILLLLYRAVYFALPALIPEDTVHAYAILEQLYRRIFIH